MQRTVLVIPDGHVDDLNDQSRWSLLGHLIVDRKPDVIVELGDFVSVNSLSHFDKHKSRVMENKRFPLEMQAGRHALSLLFDPMDTHNMKMRKQHGPKYKPVVIWCEGNHEHRVTMYLDYHAQLEGQLELHLPHNLNYASFPITQVVPFKEYVTINGVSFTHAPINSAAKAVSGKYAIQRASEIFGTSLVFGHLHRKEGLNVKRHGVNLTQFNSAGCFFEHTDDYAEGAQNVYWRGVIFLTMWDDLDPESYGRFDVDEISIARLRNEYL